MHRSNRAKYWYCARCKFKRITTQLGIISDEDKASLILWLTYIKELQAVIPDAAQSIKWPTPPVEQAS